MGDNLEIIILAIVALFILYRLYSVLGHVNEGDNIFNSSEKKIVDITDHVVAENIDDKNSEFKEFSNEIKAIKKINPDFSIAFFIKSAEAAFESIINAQVKGNKETLKSLLSKQLYSIFINEIDKLTQENIIFNKTIVAINNIDIKNIKLKDNQATICLIFSYEQITFKKDQDGHIIEGDESYIVDMAEIWQFSRNLSDQSPIWLLEKISAA
jgi:predicted lipid-binding transport protein (Tim44 family)